MTAWLDHDGYRPGSQVRVTLHGGQQGGWMRALLYDHNNNEIARASGPTGSGDDGFDWLVHFPVSLETVAPSLPGVYEWAVAWYGSYDSQVGEHIEVRIPLPMVVMDDMTAVPNDSDDLHDGAGQRSTTWGAIKALF